jgi:cob(I)alamin adenosyltransferase
MHPPKNAAAVRLGIAAAEEMLGERKSRAGRRRVRPWRDTVAGVSKRSNRWQRQNPFLSSPACARSVLSSGAWHTLYQKGGFAKNHSPTRGTSGDSLDASFRAVDHPPQRRTTFERTAQRQGRRSAMVYLDRLYTRSGDDGETGLGDGSRVRKTHPRVVALGAVDELNTALGIVLAGEISGLARTALAGIQNDLFDLGADLAVPAAEGSSTGLGIKPEQIADLECRIDAATAQLQPLTSFILPGGSPAAAALHLARAVCRRAEIEVLRLAESEPLNPQVPIYLNRLSDLLFALARLANDGGRADVLWKPGG